MFVFILHNLQIQHIKNNERKLSRTEKHTSLPIILYNII